MAESVRDRKAALRGALVDIAEARIAEVGHAGLRARIMAAEAGCSVGAIYTHFDDLTALVLAVNARTAARLDEALHAASKGLHGLSPRERLILTSYAYLGFAAGNRHLWRALCAEQPADGDGATLDGFTALLAEPLDEVFPGLGPREHALMARALAGAVHGIVLLGLEGRGPALPVEQIEEMLAQLLTRLG